ncbi:winged helix-turn-helix transcriptional regulator [Loktanella salsilacus]|uniref:winged helix-turn-helix transcriptional regulator n=1 Tax=Loktanella salsilacus TaxID=195913 RepID=UPI0037046C37
MTLYNPPFSDTCRGEITNVRLGQHRSTHSCRAFAARATVPHELSDRVGLSPTPCARRVKRLEQGGA